MSDTNTTIPSIRKLAKACGKSPTAVAGWVKHDEWQWASRGPWQAADVPAMKAWSRDVLAEDRANLDGDEAACPFYARYAPCPAPHPPRASRPADRRPRQAARHPVHGVRA